MNWAGQFTVTAVRIIGPAIILLLLTCCNWPEHGAGGMAEFYSVHDNRSQKINCTHSHIQMLRDAQADSYSPAAFYLATNLWIRALRAESGDLSLEADEDLMKLDQMLNDLTQITARRVPELSTKVKNQLGSKGCIT